MGRYRYTLDNSIAGQLVLTKDPDGWENSGRKLKRDPQYHGVFYEHSLDMSFHCNGGGMEYLINVFETQGISAEVTILIEYKCSEDSEYEEDFDGKISFDRYEKRNESLIVHIEQNDIWSLVKSRWDTKVDLLSPETLDGTSLSSLTFGGYDFTFHNRAIRFLGDFQIDSETNAGSLGLTSTASITASFLAFVEIPANVLVDDLRTGQVPVINGNSSPADGTVYVNKLANPFILSNTDHNFQALFDENYDIEVDLDFDVSWVISAGSNPVLNYSIDFRLYAGTTPNNLVNGSFRLLKSDNIAINNGLTSNGSANYTYSDSDNYTIYKNEYVFFVLFINSDYTDDTAGTATIGLEYNSAQLTYGVVDDSSVGVTIGKGWAIYEAFASVCNRIADGTNKFDSEFFGRKNSSPTSYAANGCGSFNIITPGKQIRGFPIADHPFSISLKELWEGANPMFNLGMGIESNKVVINEKEYFYEDTPILTLDYVNEITETILTGLYYSKVRVGYDRWESEDVSGIREFNNQHEYALRDVKVVNNELNLISRFITGGYPIEFTRRRQYEDNSTEDYQYDNDVFLVATKRTVDGGGNPSELDEAEKNENFTTTTNVFEPDSVYNLRHSPKRNILRNMSIISSGLTKYPGGELLFTSSLQDASIETDLNSANNCPEDYNSDLLVENSDIAWDDANIKNSAPIYEPIKYEFEHKLSYSQWKTLKSNPKGYIQLSRSNSNYKKGFIMDIDYNKEDGMAKFILIKKYEA